ncbi:MAG TPA: hypothetical protein VI197_27695 [Polyangiaceae bacterium]
MSIPSARQARWKREDEAARLSAEAPALLELRLELSESSNGRTVLDSSRIVHIVVARAAARFEVPCGDVRCKDGGYDLTHDVMHNVRQRRRSFVGQDSCNGYLGDHPCIRVLQFVAHAEFQASPP